ncbi:MAG: hypothetical protein KBD37_01600 [Burkholderiales bacterium]|nr:hypothetical protein [Burkholderiales bacterium]
MKERVISIIVDAVNIINQNLEKPLPINLMGECPIYGGKDGIDSISLVSLISIVEDSLETQLAISIILANEKSMSMQNSPFLTVGKLTDYICTLMYKESA